MGKKSQYPLISVCITISVWRFGKSNVMLSSLVFVIFDCMKFDIKIVFSCNSGEIIRHANGFAVMLMWTIKLCHSILKRNPTMYTS